MGVMSKYWPARFSDWQPFPVERKEGYTLLVPVPGDLPVFLEIALEVLAAQAAESCVETLVIPDVINTEMRQIHRGAAAGWHGPLELLPLPLPERFLLPPLKNASRNHGVQLITGIGRASGTHVILHDADLFPLGATALDDHFSETARSGLAARGVSPVWDPWFAEHGLRIAATWELCARTDWLRGFPPYLHMGHDAEMFGERHTFDTTLHAQALTPQAAIDIASPEMDMVHFNYVISTYRDFRRSRGQFLDEHWRLLLIRTFINTFARTPFDYALPSMADLAEGLRRSDARIRYPVADERSATAYADFRRKVAQIVSGRWVRDDGVAGRMSEEYAPFDAAYEFDGG